MNDPIKILVADDHALVLEGMCTVLGSSFPDAQISACVTGKQFMECCNNESYDIYIIDLEMPDISGFDLIGALRQKNPVCRIIVNTLHEERWTVNKLMDMDINGLVLKSSPVTCLEAAIKKVLKDKPYLCPNFSSLINTIKGQRIMTVRNPLPTERELTVLRYIAEGFDSKEISKNMCVSVNTIEAHRKSLMVKLGAQNMAHLVSIALNNNLIG